MPLQSKTTGLKTAHESTRMNTNQRLADPTFHLLCDSPSWYSGKGRFGFVFISADSRAVFTESFDARSLSPYAQVNESKGAKLCQSNS